MHFSAGSYYSNFQLGSAAGTYCCDIFGGNTGQFRDMMKAGYLVGLSHVGEYLDFRNEEKWGKRNVLEALYWKEDSYGLVPMLWPTSSVSFNGMIIVNEDLIASLNTEDPRDLCENKQWSWATFRDCLEKYYAKEGSEVRHYALAALAGDFGANYVLSNGHILAEKGPDGKYRSGLHDPRSLKAMEEATDVYYGDLSYTIDQNGDILAPVEALIAGRAVMGGMHYAEYVTERIAQEMTNFAVIPWPYGPDVEPGFKASFYTNLSRIIVLSALSPNIEATAIALDALYEPFEEYPTFDSVIDFLHQTYFFDRRDAQNYYDIFMNTQYVYFGSPPNKALSGWLEGRVDPVVYIESNIGTVDEYIEKEVAPTKAGIDFVWGE